MPFKFHCNRLWITDKEKYELLKFEEQKENIGYVEPKNPFF